MFTLPIGETELSFRNDLGITLEIKKHFKKDYMKVLGDIEDFSVEDHIKFIYTCLDEESKDGRTLKEFTEWVFYESGAGALDILDATTEINTEIQMPNMTLAERKKKIMEKQKEIKEFQDL